MRLPARALRWILAGLFLIVVLVAIAGTWIIPAVIVGQIRRVHDGHVAMDGWWLGLRSVGVRGLTLHEGPEPSSPAWLHAASVNATLSLAGMLTGRRNPGTLTIDRPEVTYRLDRDGLPLTRIPVRESAGPPPEVPHLQVRDGRVNIVREGRAIGFVVEGIGAAAALEPGGSVKVTAEASDPRWGRWDASGLVGAYFHSGSLRLNGRDVTIDSEKIQRLVFVPDEVWEHVVPSGQVDVTAELRLGTDTADVPTLRTNVSLRGTTVQLPTLGLLSTGTTGELTMEHQMLTLKDLAGNALDGRIFGAGLMDFSGQRPTFDLDLRIEEVNVARTPEPWGLTELELTGTISGRANLKGILNDQGVDLSGTTGSAVITGGSLQGIPVKSLRLTMRGEGDHLRYDTDRPVGSSSARLPRAASLIVSALQVPPPRTPQDPSEDDAAPPRDPPSEPTATDEAAAPRGLRLPREIHTEIELDDVDLAEVLARVEAVGLHLPFAVAGRLSLKANATIPLGSLREIRAYAFHGEASLRAAHLAGVDLGDVRATLDLNEGVLDLSDFRGVLVDRPDGGLKNLAGPTDPAPAEGPLPPGGFRAQLRAEIDPPGLLSARIEGNALPLGELAAPRLPHPTPLSGRLSVDAELHAEVARLAEPAAWEGRGTVAAEALSYQGNDLERVSTDFTVNDGKLTLANLRSHLDGQPLTARGEVVLAAPFAFELALDVDNWGLAALPRLVPGIPSNLAAGGTLSATFAATGTLQPRELQLRGEGQIAEFLAGGVPLGDVPFRVVTEAEGIRLTVPEARPFGGTLALDARIPRDGGRVDAVATFDGIDLAQVAEVLPEGTEMNLAGRATGRADLRLQSDPEPGIPPLQLKVALKAPDLNIQGLAASSLDAVVVLQDRVVRYELTAESLGGRVRLLGEIPIDPPTNPSVNEPIPGVEPQARLRVVGFSLVELWTALGLEGTLADLGGLGALDANLLGAPAIASLRVGGNVEFRDLTWRTAPLGNVRGSLARTPTGWSITPLTGTLFEGQFQGSLRGTAAVGEEPFTEFQATLNGARLERALATVFPEAQRFEGRGSARLSGQFGASLRSRGEIELAQGRFAGLPVSEARVPVELNYSPSGRIGQLRLRDWRARLAGGQVRGEAELGLGPDQAYRGRLRLDAIDLEVIARQWTDTARPSSGRISGQATFAGNRPSDPRRLRGQVDLTLADASVFHLPVFREMSRFLGAAQGGVFESGEVRAGIANGQVLVESLDLSGRVVQLHAEGTIGFDTRLDLKVLVNTNQIIPQTGEALVRLIPGLSAVLGQRDQATLRVAGFLSNRLLKLRVTGTLARPSVSVDPTILVTETAVGFFAGALRLPLAFLR